MTIIEENDLRGWLTVQQHVGNDQLAGLSLVTSAAIKDVQKHCGRDFAVSDPEVTPTRIFDGGQCTLMIDDFVGTPTVEESPDHATWTAFSGAVWTEPDNETTKYRICSMSSFGRWVRVDAAWGVSVVPDDVKLAALMWGARLWERRSSASGVQGFGEFGPIRVSRIDDPDVVTLLSDHRRMHKVAGIA